MKPILNEKQTITLQNMLSSSINSDVKFAIKMMENYDFDKSIEYYVFILCKNIEVINKNKTTKLKKIIKTANIDMSEVVKDKKTFYLNYLRKSNKANLSTVLQLSNLI